MSIVAIKGVPFRWSMKALYLVLLKGVRWLKGEFEVLNFDKPRGEFKTAYVRVSEKLDPLRAVEAVNRLSMRSCKLFASIPTYVPDLPLASTNLSKNKFVHQTHIAKEATEWVLESTLKDLIEELQLKYRGLFILSQKKDHKLLDEIATILYRRLKPLLDKNNEHNCYLLSKAYRTAHPHFADFQLILSSLHRLEDAAGAPRTQVLEPELANGTALSTAFHESLGNLNKILVKYSAKFIERLTARVDRLEDEFEATQAMYSEETRRHVREQLLSLRPHLAQMVKQTMGSLYPSDIKDHFTIHVYGEPTLPPRSALAPLLQARNAGIAQRCTRLFNLLRCVTPPAHYNAICALDNTVLCGCRLIVRVIRGQRWQPPAALLAALAADDAPLSDHNMDFEDGEDWAPEDLNSMV